MSAVEQAREADARRLVLDTVRGGSRQYALMVERLAAYRAAVRAERDAAWREGVAALTRYRGIKQSIQRNGDMVRWTWPADEEKHRYCANVLDRNDVLALAARMEAK